MPERMTAAVLDSFGEGDVLSLREIAIADPGPMEVRVRLLTSGVCRSDIHFLRGVWNYPAPVILGARGLRNHRRGRTRGAGIASG